MQYMLRLLADQSSVYHDEVALALSDEFEDLEVSVDIVKRALKKLNWSRKVAKRRILESTREMRNLWDVKQRHWSLDQLVFIDESGANERTGWRKRGWSPVGVSCAALQGTKRSERWSILPAMTVDGYLNDATLVYQGSINRDLFCEWLESKVLPKLRPHYHILVMDNCSIHHGEEVRELCEINGFEIEYLPPYSPDLNPIEFTFNTLKIWIKRHFNEHANYRDFGDFLRYAVHEGLSDCSSTRAATDYFKHCGYGGGDQPA